MKTLLLALLLSLPSAPVELLRGAHAISREDAQVHAAAFLRAGADRAAPRYQRMRAVSALSMVDRPEVRAGLAAIVDATDDDAEVRAQALHALSFLDRALAAPRAARATREPSKAMQATGRAVALRLAR